MIDSSDIVPHTSRPRRLRYGQNIRDLVHETSLTPGNLIQGVFITHGNTKKEPIDSMPGIFRWSIDTVHEHIDKLEHSGVKQVILFGIPDVKDARGSGADATNGIVQSAIREIKEKHPDMTVIADTCFCEYTDHGHCGVQHESAAITVDNDLTLDRLAALAVSQAESGADIIAPSGMMDGSVAVIREALDHNNFPHIPIMMYSVKYASAFYGPFRDAADGAPQSGDRKSYQMDPRNSREALLEADLDVAEGADILMVKPALSYMDIIRQLRDRYNQPIAAYNVSGEYAMVKAAADKGWIDEQRIVTEILTSLRRAGADMILTYHAEDFAGWQ